MMIAVQCLRCPAIELRMARSTRPNDGPGPASAAMACFAIEQNLRDPLVVLLYLERHRGK